MTSPELTLLYVHGHHTGYGRMGIELRKALEARGTWVGDSLGEPPSKLNIITDEVEAEPKKTNVIAWAATPSHARWWFKGQHTAMITMWETKTLPPSFRNTFDEFDHLIVPSTHNVELFSQYHDNVELMPLGVNPDHWHYTPREDDPYFNFLISGTGERKGTDLAYRAFMRVFGDQLQTGRYNHAIPRLLMKNSKGEEYSGPNVELTTGSISLASEVSLFGRAHCYLQPSRGEGFGLMPLQAIAQGIPTILTNAHGHASYAHLGYGLDTTDAKASYFVLGDAGDWWEPDFEQLCAHMEFVYENYSEALDFSQQSAAAVARDFTWANVAERFTEILGDELEKPYTGDNSHRIPEQRLYPVVTSEDYSADIGGVVYQFPKGKKMYVTADIKRTLFESLVLDPTCLEGADVGLAPQQISRRDKYNFLHGWCQKCGQRLNTSRTRADELLEIAEATSTLEYRVAELESQLAGSPDLVRSSP